MKDGNFVEWTRVTSKPIREKGTRHAPLSSEWSILMETSNGCSRGRDLTIPHCSFSICVGLVIILAVGRILCSTLTMPSLIPLLALVLWLTLHPRQ